MMRIAHARFPLLATAVAAFCLVMPGLKTRPTADTQTAQIQAPHLRPLKSVDELKSWFNANRAHPRAIFLLSPT
jgi:hypothetical protein